MEKWEVLAHIKRFAEQVQNIGYQVTLLEPTVPGELPTVIVTPNQSNAFIEHIDAAQKARIIASVRAAAVANATMWDELNLIDELDLLDTTTLRFARMVDEIAMELDTPPDGSKLSDADIWEWIEGCRQAKADAPSRSFEAAKAKIGFHAVFDQLSLLEIRSANYLLPAGAHERFCQDALIDWGQNDPSNKPFD